MNKYFNKIRQSQPINVFLLGFVSLLILNIFFLLMPFVAKGNITFIDSLFTAMSLTCLGGSSSILPASFTLFGQIYILLMSNVISVFFLTIISYILLRTFYRKFTFKQTNITDTLEGIKYVFIRVLIFTLAIELLGIIMFCIPLGSVYTGGELIINALTYSISAFTSNGILIGNLSIFANNLMFNISLFIVQLIGNVGFIVVLDCMEKKNIKKLNSFSKFALFSTIAVVLVSSVLILFFEACGNSAFAEAPTFSKLINSFNLSIASMSGGFSAFKVRSVGRATRMIMLLLSLIGAQPSSLSGGIKVTSALIIILCTVNFLLGKKNINLKEKKIGDYTIKLILSILSIYIFLILFSTAIIALVDNIAVSKILFEVCSAISLSSFSIGIVGKLSAFSKLILMLLMAFGRVGMIYLVWMISNNQKTTIDEELEEMEVIVG